MKGISQWFCRACKSVKARAAFPKHIDANTKCLECQSGKSGYSHSSDQAAGQDVPVYVRRSYKPRHGTDNRDID